MKLKQVVDFLIGTDWFHLTAEHFPRDTKDLIALHSILEWGMLPLGIKHKTAWFHQRSFLNIGVISLQIPGIYSEAELLARRALGADYGGYQIFRLRVSEFAHVLDAVYGIAPSHLAGHPHLSTAVRELLEG